MPTIITNGGQSKITNAITSASKIFPKYFKVSNIDYALDPTLTDITGWLQKDISSWIIVDNNNILITCVIEEYEAVNQATTFGIYDIDGTLLFIAKPDNPYPPKTRQAVTLSILYTNISQVLDFSYLPWNDQEVYLLLEQISTQYANEFVEVYNRITGLQSETAQLRLDMDNILTGGTLDSRYINRNGDNIEGTFTFQNNSTINVNGNIVLNGSDVLTRNDLSGTVEYHAINLTPVSTHTFTIPDDGWWLIVTTGVVTCGVNSSWSRLYVNGNLASTLFIDNWPGNAPVTHTASGYFTAGSSVTLLLDCADVRTVRAIRFMI